jgi:hypothetical protein
MSQVGTVGPNVTSEQVKECFLNTPQLPVTTGGVRSCWEAASVFYSSAYISVLPRLIPAAFALLHYVTLSCLVPVESVPVTARNEEIPFHGLLSQGTNAMWALGRVGSVEGVG